MADFPSYAANEEENAEIKRINAEIVRVAATRARNPG